jgi:hypothetical protein
VDLKTTRLRIFFAPMFSSLILKLEILDGKKNYFEFHCCPSAFRVNLERFTKKKKLKFVL